MMFLALYLMAVTAAVLLGPIQIRSTKNEGDS